MKILTSIIDKFFEEKLTKDEYEDIFLQLGYEVESITPIRNAKDIVIARTLSCEKHPNADNLSLLKVDYNGEKLDVVCGGNNVKEDQTIIYAPVGSTVGGHVLEPKELRGIVSHGMILSLSEIANISKELIPEEERGNILEITNRTLENYSIEEFYEENFLDGWVFDLDILNDRAYANSHTMIAKEIAAFKNFEFSIFLPSATKSSLASNVSVNNFSYDENVTSLQNVMINFNKNASSPLSIKIPLYFSKIKITNKIEDILNFMLIVNGVSVYLSDNLNKIALVNKKLILDEQIVDIYTSSNILTTDDLDKVEDKEFSLTAFSTNVKENPLVVKNINPTHGLLHTKGSNAHLVNITLNQVIKLLTKYGYIDYYSQVNSYIKNDVTKLLISIKKIKEIIGFEFDLSRVLKVLVNLNFEIEASGEDKLLVIVPSYRNDIISTQDFVEEIVRVIGTEALIPSNEVPRSLEEPLEDERVKAIEFFNDYLTQFNFHEARTYYLVDENNFNEYNIFDIQDGLKLKEEFSFKNNFYRNSIMSSLIDTYVFNYRKNEKEQRSFAFFESANIFSEVYEGLHGGVIIDDLFSKELSPTLVLKEFLRDFVEHYHLSFDKLQFLSFSKSNIFNKYNAVKVFYEGNQVAVIGEVHPRILRLKKLIRLDKMKRNLFYMEINFSELIKHNG